MPTTSATASPRRRGRSTTRRRRRAASTARPLRPTRANWRRRGSRSSPCRRCRKTRTSSPRRRPTSVDVLLGLFAERHDVANGKQNPFQLATPVSLVTEQEFKIHSEVLEFLLLRILHDRLRRTVLLDRDALLVPANRLRLLDERGNHARERPRRGRQLGRRLVVLIEAHRITSLGADAPEAAAAQSRQGSRWEIRSGLPSR